MELKAGASRAEALGAMRVHEILQAAREGGASDVHLADDRTAAVRIEGELTRRPDAHVSAEELQTFLREWLDERSLALLAGRGFCDVAVHSQRLGAMRLHVFRALGATRCAVRLFPASIPVLESLDLPVSVESLTMRRAGLVLVVGPTGSGKTTLLAAMIDVLNRRDARHVVTFEDPVEYLHSSDRCVIAQCEIDRDVDGLASGTNAVLRADPDVIVIGELRDSDSMRSALSAAETGHLVLASLHTVDAPQALDRIVDSFSAEGRDQIRIQLAQTLAGVIALRLVPKAHSRGRRAVAEILVATDAVRNLVREGKTHQLRSVMQTGKSAGMQTMEMHFSMLCRRGEIRLETARLHSQHPAEITSETSDA